MVELNKDERIDDLLTHGLYIIQSDEVFSFSLDAVLLGRFAPAPPKGRIIDLCSGNGVIPMLLATRTKAQIDAVEIQERLYHMANRSVAMNKLEHQIRMIHGDLRDIHLKLGQGGYDVVTVNPPYMPVPAGEQNMNPHFAAARHEIHSTLEDVIVASGRLLRNRGKLAMVHRAGRFVDICYMMRQYRIEPKRVRFVHSRQDEEASMVLIEAMKEGKPGLRIESPLIVFNDKNEYCPELMEVFYGKKGSI
ncbi:tRNA1(Val) (adenine(37)-N6)-methyltransferase [Paenibacillus albiflavus]|uniref:tRNA1(Val) (Adenine(37)-N6)-methyltransferase n=1 Tax=Paenibacillus albiflavus TaxID=2545760 RepID=A0A4R4E3G4_9BACL|nr:tRNA1(Val) (adenine(37)-N6)-methyltransferase [Paenibacillus albiflavus]TCZ70550.1 tRNA1(Val) (adenine(37)-N6)-methyltransferase [Paenibacillus albiflavus]